jgi:hypothetical protein
MKTVIVEKNNRKFICNIGSEFGGAMCCVQIWEEARPNWKIFRNRYCTYKTFWVNKYETIKKGIEAMVDSYLEDEREDEVFEAKWAELE